VQKAEPHNSNSTCRLGRAGTCLTLLIACASVLSNWIILLVPTK